MRVRSAEELGDVLRERRQQLGRSQADLAAETDVSRKWIIDLERGRERAPFGLVLRIIESLGLELDLPAPGGAPPHGGAALDLDEHLSQFRRSRD